MYSLDEINICAKNEAFVQSCKNGNKEIVMWLYSLGGINIHAENNEAFKQSCKNNKIHIAKWLSSIYPNYCVKTSNNKIINWYIRNSFDDAFDNILKLNYKKCIKILKIKFL